MGDDNDDVLSSAVGERCPKRPANTEMVLAPTDRPCRAGRTLTAFTDFGAQELPGITGVMIYG